MAHGEALSVNVKDWMFPRDSDWWIWCVSTPLRTWAIWWGWNTFCHDLLHWPAMDYWFQPVALLFLITSFHAHRAYSYVRLMSPSR